MKPLWENSLVPVLRDVQWLQHIKSGGQGLPPDILHVLSGGSESLVGDVLFSSASRFFVFELKSASSKISTEWKTSSGKSKALYKHLKALVTKIAEADANSRLPTVEEETLLSLSLKGHFFVYPEKVPEGVWKVEIWADSYILAASEKVSNFSRKMTVLPSHYTVDKASPKKDAANQKIPIQSVMEGGWGIFEKRRDMGRRGGWQRIGDLGMDSLELEKYLDFLASAGGSGEVRTIIVDAEGKFFAVVDDISGLVRIHTHIQNGNLGLQNKVKTTIGV